MAKWSRDKVDSSTLNSGNEYSKDSVLAVDELNAMVNAGLFAQDFVEQLGVEIDVSEIAYEGKPSVTLIDGVNSTPQRPYKRFKFANLKGPRGLPTLVAIRNMEEVFYPFSVGQTFNFNSSYFNRTPSGDEFFWNMDAGSNMCLWRIVSTIETTPVTYVAELLNIRSCKGDKGDKGDKGSTGAIGPTPNITITATSQEAGSTPTVTQSGTAEAPTFELGIPKGDKGDTGATGPKGDTGATPAITMTASSLPAGSTPTVTQSGTAEAPTFELGIPISATFEISGTTLKITTGG